MDQLCSICNEPTTEPFVTVDDRVLCAACREDVVR